MVRGEDPLRSKINECWQREPLPRVREAADDFDNGHKANANRAFAVLEKLKGSRGATSVSARRAFEMSLVAVRFELTPQ